MEKGTERFIVFFLFMLVSTFVGLAGLVMIVINAWRNTLGMHITSEWLFWACVACFIPLGLYIGGFVRDQRNEHLQ